MKITFHFKCTFLIIFIFTVPFLSGCSDSDKNDSVYDIDNVIEDEEPDTISDVDEEDFDETIDEEKIDETIDDDSEQVVCDPEKDTCIGEVVDDFNLINCSSGENVNIYSLAQEKKILWFVLTVGWCSSCHEYIPQVIEYSQPKQNDLQLIYFLGEDEHEGKPTLQYCKQYASGYELDPSFLYISQNGDSSFSVIFDNMFPYSTEEGVISLPWNSLLNADTKIYEYCDNAPGVDNLQNTIESLLNQ